MRYSNFFSLNYILIKSFESKVKYSKDCWILMLYIPAYCPILQNYLVPWCCTTQILSIMYTDCESYCLLSGHLSFGPMRNIYCWIIGKLSCRCYILKKNLWMCIQTSNWLLTLYRYVFYKWKLVFSQS